MQVTLSVASAIAVARRTCFNNLCVCKIISDFSLASSPSEAELLLYAIAAKARSRGGGGEKHHHEALLHRHPLGGHPIFQCHPRVARLFAEEIEPETARQKTLQQAKLLARPDCHLHSP